MDERVYWIWAQEAFQQGSPMPMKLARQYAGGLREFWEGGPKMWNSRRDIKDGQAILLRDFTLRQAEARLEYAEKVGWRVFCPGCEEYPRLLENIPDPPAVLYSKGVLPDLDRILPVAVVGARKALPASVEAARQFGFQLAADGACVVSGGAVGVDAGALSGALQSPGARMVSVLPVSLDSDYVLENSRLRGLICQAGGVLLSEHFSQRRPAFGAFPVRNRLITGLSRGVLIIQAARKSGSMLYASLALEQDRDVYVYPGPEGETRFAGSRSLLEDGAKAVYSGEEILEEYGNLHRQADRPAKVPEKRASRPGRASTPRNSRPVPAHALGDPAAGLSSQARRVWEALGAEPKSVAELSEEAGLPASSLLGVLTQLELEGLAVSLPGKRFIRG